MKAKDIILMVATLGIGYLVYTEFVKAKPTKPPERKEYEHCGPMDQGYYCGGKLYCCKKKNYIIDKINKTEPPIRVVYNLCEGGVMNSYHKDFDTREQAIQWVRNAYVCLVTAYHVSKPKPPRRGPPPRRPRPRPVSGPGYHPPRYQPV